MKYAKWKDEDFTYVALYVCICLGRQISCTKQLELWVYVSRSVKWNTEHENSGNIVAMDWSMFLTLNVRVFRDGAFGMY